MAGVKEIHTNRMKKELDFLLKTSPGYFVSIAKEPPKAKSTLETYLMRFKAPEPFNAAPLALYIDISTEYPFKPPSLRFKRAIYHPNVCAINGEACIPLLTLDNWKPSASLDAVMLSLLDILAEPDISRPIRMEVAELYIKDNPEYLKRAASSAGEKQ